MPTTTTISTEAGAQTEAPERARPGASAPGSLVTSVARDDELLAGLPGTALQQLSAHVAVLDASGRVMLVNQAWRSFASRNGGDQGDRVCVGADYLGICRRAATNDEHAARALAGIETVLSGLFRQFSMEYPCHGRHRQRWFLMTVSPLDEMQSGAVIAHQDITPQKLAEQALQEREQRMRRIFAQAAVGLAEIDADGRMQRVNESLCRMLGRSPAELSTRRYLQLTHPADRDADASRMELLRSGAVESTRSEKRCLREDGTEVWVKSTLSALREADGPVEGYVAVIEDISERRQIEQRQRTLLQEFSHRGRNLLTVIQSIANLSLAGERPLEEEREAFTGRIEALARTYGALASETFDGASLDNILRTELLPFGDRVRLDGPAVALSIKPAQTFTLIAHELATNAAKHGALSVPGGRVDVRWSIGGGASARTLKFEWRESHGPPATAPERQGFGSTLIGEVAAAEFECQPRCDHDPDGFHYGFEAPLARLGSPISESPVRQRLKSAQVAALYDHWARLRGPDGELPRLEGLDWTRFSATGALTIAAIEHGGESVRFVQVGRALVERLGHRLDAGELAEETEMQLTAIYQHCAAKGQPSHEYLRFDFGDGEPLSFERLLLPFSTSAGQTVTHVVGIAVYDGNTRTPTGADHEHPHG